MNREELIQIILGHGQLSEGALADAILAALPCWIPVEGIIPKATGLYLVADSRGAVFIAEYIRARRLPYGFYIPESMPIAAEKITNITHWMPLPAAPEQDQPA